MILKVEIELVISRRGEGGKRALWNRGDGGNNVGIGVWGGCDV